MAEAAANYQSAAEALAKGATLSGALVEEALAKGATLSGALVEVVLNSLVATSACTSSAGPGCFSVGCGVLVCVTSPGAVPRAVVASRGLTNVRAATEVSVAGWLTQEKPTPAPAVAPTAVATRTTRTLRAKVGVGAR